MPPPFFFFGPCCTAHWQVHKRPYNELLRPSLHSKREPYNHASMGVDSRNFYARCSKKQQFLTGIMHKHRSGLPPSLSLITPTGIMHKHRPGLFHVVAALTFPFLHTAVTRPCRTSPTWLLRRSHFATLWNSWTGSFSYPSMHTTYNPGRVSCINLSRRSVLSFLLFWPRPVL